METKSGKQRLKQKRDEAQVQAHLLNLEIKDQVKFLKQGVQVVKRNLQPLRPVWEQAIKRLRLSVNPFVKSCKATLKQTNEQLREIYRSKRA